jgi:hypothetical protein
LIWIAPTPLKKLESNEENQENPRKSKPFFLGFLGSALGNFGLQRSAGGGRLSVALPEQDHRRLDRLGPSVAGPDAPAL